MLMMRFIKPTFILCIFKVLDGSGLLIFVGADFNPCGQVVICSSLPCNQVAEPDSRQVDQARLNW